MSNKKLVVVESPAKAKTINKYLGKDYIVEASVGHIKDLVKYGLGVDVKNNFKPKYVTITGKSEIIKKIKAHAEKASEVLIATDPDREGEAIAWHLAEEIKTKNSNIKRVLFNEITKSGIDRGLKAPMEINNNLFMSQQARRVLDRLIGFQVSPFLSKAMLSKTSQSLSAGRVQSVALRLIAERDSEIQAFVPIDYWNIFGTFATPEGKNIKARLVSFMGDQIKNPDGSAKGMTDEETAEIKERLKKLHFIRTEDLADDLINKIIKEEYLIRDLTKKTIRRNPTPPFTTSSLQQEASKRLGFSNKVTMSIAQKLYEGVPLGEEGSVGLITYMRTDSVRISAEAQTAAQEFIKTAYGEDYIPPTPPMYVSKSSNVQDAHEAIRPTSLDYLPREVSKYLDKKLASLYELIYNRFIASQMSSAVIDQTTVNIADGDFLFRATGSVIVFKGFLAAYDDIKEEKEDKEDKDDNKEENGLVVEKEDASLLPENLVPDMKLDLNLPEKTKSQTKPKPRYTESSLVKELDERGIGRPSTYASIISTLVDRQYVDLIKKAFFITELGSDVSIILTKHFNELFNVAFTAEMEYELDTIADGNKTYEEVLNNFYLPFTNTLQKAETMSDIPIIQCETCGSPMVIKVSRRGRFLGCSKYPECTNTKPLPKGDAQEKQEPQIAEGIVCDICGKPMVYRDSRFGKFLGCTDYPNCKGIKPISTTVKCPKCKEGTLLERYSPKSRKKFWGCSAYPNCDYLTNHEPINEKCPACNNEYIEIRFRKKDEEWEKYKKCPACNQNFEYPEKKEE